MKRLTAILLLFSGIASGQSIAVDTSRTVAKVSPSLYGLMTEEINYSYDGGLYAELIGNRTFARGEKRGEWTVVAKGDADASVSYEQSGGPSKALTRYAKLTIAAARPGAEAGVANAGYWGMAISPATTYRGSFWASTEQQRQATARLIDDNTGRVLGEAKVALNGGDGWHSYAFELKTGASFAPGSERHFELLFDRPGDVGLQLISLFPPTYAGRPNGNRADLMQMLAAMKPKFLRFPGGNYLEGDTIKERFNWRETIGPWVDRPTHRSPWGYQSTDGMGLLEFLEWTEDLHMAPVLAIYAGYSLHGEHVVGKDLEPFVQDALDEIEYVTGDTNTKWGAVRARDGHPAPFAVQYIEVGNEDQFDKAHTYDERFAAFASAIRARYGQRFQLIATTPVHAGLPDVIDDHYYEKPDVMFTLVHKYDKADRRGPKIFVGEWATRTGSPTPDFGAALGDAAWMTGMERNADLVVMASYAPLLTNVNAGGMQWSTDLIGFNAAACYGSPSYWAQVMFSTHLGDGILPVQTEGFGPRLFASATLSTETHTLHLKVVNANSTDAHITLRIPGAHGSAAITRLHAATYAATNTIAAPDRIRPTSSIEAVPGKVWVHAIQANTIEVLDVPLTMKP